MVAETSSGARASVRYLPASPYKIRQVLDLVRGLPVDDAERVLQVSDKDAARDLAKLLASAIANAQHNHSLEPDELFVARAWCDEGPTRKWGQPRARGRYFRIRRRTSHVTIVLERFETEELEARRRREESSGRGAATAQRRRAERVRRSRQAAAEPESEDTEPDTAAEGPAAEATPAVEATGVEAGAETADEATDEEEE